MYGSSSAEKDTYENVQAAKVLLNLLDGVADSLVVSHWMLWVAVRRKKRECER